MSGFRQVVSGGQQLTGGRLPAGPAEPLPFPTGTYTRFGTVGFQMDGAVDFERVEFGTQIGTVSPTGTTSLRELKDDLGFFQKRFIPDRYSV